MVRSEEIEIARAPASPDPARVLAGSKDPLRASDSLLLRESPAPSAIALQAAIVRALARDGSPRSALQRCADAVAQYAGAALVRIWTCGTGAMTLQASAGHAVPRDDARNPVPVGQFTSGHIARTRKPLLVDSLLEHPNIHDKEWSRREGMTSFAGCPLLVDDDLQGVLAIFDRKPIPPATFQAIVAIAPEVAQAILRNPVEEPAGGPVDGAWTEHAVIVTRLDGTIADWNHGAEKLFGYRRAAVLGRPLTVLVPSEHAAEHAAILLRAVRGEQVALPETPRLHKSGQLLPVRLTVSPLRGDGGRVVGAVSVAHDLSDVKLLRQQCCLAQKMEIFGRLVGGVAHDFNNILTIVLGYSEIAFGQAAARDPQRELLREIRKAGEKGASLTRQLLAFTRQKVAEPRLLDLNAVIRDTEIMLHRLIGEDVQMTTSLAPGLKPVKVDPGHVQQIVLNLAVNARDAMPRGGRLTIETDNVSLDEAYARAHPHTQPGDYVYLSMTDTGVGMSRETLARLFEPLFTTKGPGKGTGLGLTTVQSIVRQYGGHIEVSSDLGRGATFKVYLPQAEDAPALAESPSHPDEVPHGTETILLVEDDDSVRSLSRHVLELAGYQVLEAADGDDALKVAQNHSGPLHLLIADVVMPNLGGRPLADCLLQRLPSLKVLFMSGYTSDAVNRHGVLDTDHSFLQKPFTTAALAQKVREVLDAK
jgi:PAS domain S-box-containing protein